MDDDYFASIPVFDSFERIVDSAIYRPLPEGWFIGFTDVVDSTQAIGTGRYKPVNMAGAAAIAALSNALNGKSFPYAFGGDGATLAVAGPDEPLARGALAATARWVKEQLGLELRAALVPVGDVRMAGHDIAIARYAPSPDVAYAMFSGGGVGWIEHQVKSGHYLVDPAPPRTYPDLTGLSCRFGETPATRGVIASVIVLPGQQGDGVGYRRLVSQVLAMTADPQRAGHPLPSAGPPVVWPPKGLPMEVAARADSGLPRVVRWASVAAFNLLAWATFKFDLTIGSFDAGRYRRELVANADYRKFDDGLRLTLDCTPELADELETLLTKAQAEGTARFGMHRQTSALVTCVAPVPTRSDHVHFVDGGGGGYAAAARAMKEDSGYHSPSGPR